MNKKSLFSQKMPEYQSRIADLLVRNLPTAQVHAPILDQALRYAALGEGKRIRPLLVYATGETLGLAPETLDAAACAIELIHTYSLIHDDLPAMDDDDLRRGRPTVHKQFDEATAILVGDALLTLAFEVIAHADVPAQLRVEWVSCLARAAGAAGMIAGQSIDLASENKTLNIDALQTMHSLKTGALIAASVEMASQAKADLSHESKQALMHFARGIGLAFQIRDDIIDVESTTEVLGKSQGADEHKGKSTYVSLLGLEKAKHLAETEYKNACANLNRFGTNAEPLRWLAELIVNRSN